ncbi:SusD/RagB family nutrient-binding outer membrane lipoprotein [Niabella soli]|uniref:SusD/RagB family nutrient-binding outer membrane lipoprotein n=1 Tax=Niabella soli DSM 19437 TaxID=929713 RepID=W0EXI6_9BACT|nr:SusD/RagB family nutrient-binding outer membrane lipoprotein [Niabella soli]AHF15487.1 hypothetical protein NIASO_10655 [Niabella soli DSM 19437]
MKKINILLLSGLVIWGTSCKKFLDINQNPNDATSSTPQLILPQAITGTASQLNGYNSMGAQFGLYMANAGGYGAFGETVTYEFSSGYNSGRWPGMYDVLEDLQTVIDGSATDESLKFFNAIARIMKAHAFQKLVDAYNSIPYSEALQGQKKLQPKYDDPAVIYADLAKELDKAIADINAAQAATVKPVAVKPTQDPMFGGDMNLWKKFANTLKLRIMVTGNGKATFSNKNFDPAGFLTTDALVNPGYVRDVNKQNPKWQTWGFSSTGSDGNKAWMPSTFILAFYTGAKLKDAGRGRAIYYKYPNTPTNRLGLEGSSIESSPSGSFWLPSDNRDGKTAGSATGVLKGPEASMPILTAAESDFIQAEAIEKGIITGSSSDAFSAGINASFKYLYQLPDGTSAISSDSISTLVAKYLDDNSTSPLVNFSLATSPAQKLEAIITQKFIALNMINSEEAWNDYRRTHYPTLNNANGATGTQTFASSQSKSTRADHLPTRILYPGTEGAYNSTNVPKGISPFTSLIFWAQ